MREPQALELAVIGVKHPRALQGLQAPVVHAPWASDERQGISCREIPFRAGALQEIDLGDEAHGRELFSGWCSSAQSSVRKGDAGRPRGIFQSAIGVILPAVAHGHWLIEIGRAHARRCPSPTISASAHVQRRSAPAIWKAPAVPVFTPQRNPSPDMDEAHKNGAVLDPMIRRERGMPGLFDEVQYSRPAPSAQPLLPPASLRRGWILSGLAPVSIVTASPVAGTVRACQQLRIAQFRPVAVARLGACELCDLASWTMPKAQRAHRATACAKS